MEQLIDFSDEKKSYLGHKLAEVLLLRKETDGRYYTEFGNKTGLGLYETAVRILKGNI